MKLHLASQPTVTTSAFFLDFFILIEHKIAFHIFIFSRLNKVSGLKAHSAPLKQAPFIARIDTECFILFPKFSYS